MHRVIKSKSLVKATNWYEHRAKIKCKKWFWKRFFQAKKQCNFWKKYGKCEKVWKMWENVEISSLWQPKQRGII